MKRQIPFYIFTLLLIGFASQAQLAGFNFIKPITVTNTSTTTAIDYQLKLTINTQSIISATEMQANGADIRFGKNCDGSINYNYWLESGINTTTTSIWVKIDTIMAGASRTFYFFHGNNTAVSASSIPLVFIGSKSATDSVISPTSGGVANSQRGFRFAPKEDILVTSFGKREPNGTQRFVTLFNYSTTATVAQLQVSGPAATYTYAALANPLWLTANTQYVLELFQGTGDGYYYGSSSQINNKLTYYDMRYCNSCTQNTFPTSVLTNFHYGNPDMQFYWKNSITPTPTYTIGDNLPAISATANTNTICANDSVILTAISTGTNYTYNWMPGSLTGATVIATPTINTTYTVTGNIGNCPLSMVMINVNAKPSIVTSTSNSLICAGQSATISANGGDTYTWTPSGSGAMIVVTPTISTSYTVIGTNTLTGCSNTDTITQFVSPCTSINSITKNEVYNLYPNPNSGTFTIRLDDYSQVEITNVLGDKVFEAKLSKGINTINLRNHSEGIYFIRIHLQDKMYTSKIIIQ